MKSFWGKREKAGAAKTDDSASGNEDRFRTERRLTVGLTRAEQLAMMLAKSRAAKFVEVADMLAGIYIYDWDRLSKFWDDQTQVEEFLRRICSISPQRWHHWIEVYDKQRRQEEHELTSPLHRLSLGIKGQDGDALDQEVTLQRSIELDSILQHAGELSPFRDDLDGRAIPVLTTECVLLCIALNPELDVSRRLCETGLDLSALERAARDPRRAPHR